MRAPSAPVPRSSARNRRAGSIGGVRSHLACAALIALLPFGLACTTNAARAPAGSVVQAGELPQREREVWERYHAGGAAWELERERVLADPALGRFVVDNLVREMVSSYDRSRLARAGERAGPFERAQSELVELAPISTPVLVELVGVRDGIVSFLGADLLARIGAPALRPLLAKLGDAQPEVRRRAAELYARLPPGAGSAEEAQVGEALARLVEKDPAWIVRAQAARSVGARGARGTHKGFAAGVLARALADADASVVESAANALRELAEPRAVPLLIDALERSLAAGQLGAARAAQETLRALTGQKRDLLPQEWRRWWADEGERATLAH